MKRLLAGALSLFALTVRRFAGDPDPAKWDAVLAEAKGETVYWNAWGGAENINAYIEWAGAEVERRYGVKLVHVKLDDTAGAVAKVVAEKAAGKNEGGSVDLIWINGENFASMKKQQSAAFAGLGGEAAQLAICRRRREADGPHRFHHPRRWAGKPVGHGEAGVLPRHGQDRSGVDAEIGQGIARLGEEESRPLHLSAAAGLHRLVVPEAGGHRTGRRSRRPA